MQQLHRQKYFNNHHQFENASDLSGVMLGDLLSDLRVFDGQSEMVELKVSLLAVGVLLIERK